MAPPTIANGRVYLASFGAENVGTGQFCVYGLLPAAAGAKLAAVTDGHADIRNRMLTLTWNAVPGARFYRVQRASSLEPKGTTIATGLTTPSFTEPAPERGEQATYSIIAVGQNGPAPRSAPVTVAGSPKPKPED
jgi:hypothetical protein